MGFFRIKAPVFNDAFVRQQTLVVLALVAITATVMVSLHNSQIMVLDSTIVGQSADIFGYFGGLSGFLFGFFVFDNLATYVNLKNNVLGGFWGAFQDTMSLTGAWIPETDEKSMQFKETIVRWGLAALALMTTSAAGDYTPEQGVEEAMRRGLLTADEAELVRRTGYFPQTTLICMLGAFETKLANSSVRADIKINKIEDKINTMRGCIGGVLDTVSAWGLTPLPLVHLMSALVKIVSLKHEMAPPLPTLFSLPPSCLHRRL